MSDGTGRNVLVVVLDTVRKDHLTPYGYDRPTTPGLASFAEEARVYEEAVAPAPWTLPVHASMFTGLYPDEHGASQATPYLDDGIGTLAEALSTAGFATACYSSNAWITPYTRLTAGFAEQDNFFEVMPGDFLSGALADLWERVNENDRLRAVANRLVEFGNRVHEHLAGGERAASKTPAVIDNTIEFVADAGEDGDWFAFVNLMDAHLPVYPPEEYREEFAPDVDPDAVCQNAKEYNSGARDVSDAEFAAIERLYDAEIRHMDAEVERLFDWLRANDEWEDTLVVVCADHGELHGEHGLFGHEFCLYEPLVNVPLLVKAPGLEPGRDESTTVELQDLYHTVLDYTGVAVPPGDAAAQGDSTERVDAETTDADSAHVPLDDRRSLLSADYREFAGGEYGFVEYERPVVELQQLETKAERAGITLDEDSRFYSRMRAARRPDGKYVQNERIPDEAYRLDRDPGETENLADDDDPVIADVEAALADFAERVGEPWADGDGVDDEGDDDVLEGMSEDAKRRLEDLGYTE